MDGRIETISADTQSARARVTEDEFQKHYVPKQKWELQQAHDRAEQAYVNCCRETALKIWKMFGDVTDSATEVLFEDPTSPKGDRRVAENLRKLANFIAEDAS